MSTEDNVSLHCAAMALQCKRDMAEQMKAGNYKEALQSARKASALEPSNKVIKEIEALLITKNDMDNSEAESSDASSVSGSDGVLESPEDSSDSGASSNIGSGTSVTDAGAEPSSSSDEEEEECSSCIAACLGQDVSAGHEAGGGYPDTVSLNKSCFKLSKSDRDRLRHTVSASLLKQKEEDTIKQILQNNPLL